MPPPFGPKTLSETRYLLYPSLQYPDGQHPRQHHYQTADTHTGHSRTAPSSSIHKIHQVSIIQHLPLTWTCCGHG
jgi:hypothetical protein